MLFATHVVWCGVVCVCMTNIRGEEECPIHSAATAAAVMARTRQSCGSIVDTRISRCRAILRGAGCCSSCHGYRHLTTCAAATNVIVQRDHSRLHGGGGSIAPTADNPQGRRRCFRPLPTTVSFCVKMHQIRVLLARIR